MIPSFHGASEREPRNLPPECCLAAVSFAWSFISPLALVHPFPLRGPSPQGETRRDGTPLLLLKHAKYSAELATFGGSPLIPLCRTPPQRGNDSLHFARRYRSFKMCSLCIHGKACHTILRSLCSLTARLSPTHNILRVTAFLQNMFAGVTRVPLPPHPGNRINRSTFLHRVMWHVGKHP